MTELFVQSLETLRLPDDPEGADTALKAWRNTLGARQTRRMSTLGVLLTAALREETFADDPCLVYTTQYAESQALEKFIDSFPFASPLLFQTSIHPGGAEQAMIARRQAVSEFFPLAGAAPISAALRLASVTTRPRTVWIGGEERGSWLREVKEASEASFGWALSLSRSSEKALARISWETGGAGASPEPSLETFQEILAYRRNTSWSDPALGTCSWQWL